MEHTTECKERVAEHEAWFKQWPNACRECVGVGYVGTSYTGSFEDPGEPDPCLYCLGENKCPRCGTFQQKWLDGDEQGGFEGPCITCAWTGLLVGDYAPINDCDCGYEYLDDDYDVDIAAEAATEEWDEYQWDAYYAASDMAYDAWREGQYR